MASQGSSHGKYSLCLPNIFPSNHKPWDKGSLEVAFSRTFSSAMDGCSPLDWEQYCPDGLWPNLGSTVQTPSFHLFVSLGNSSTEIQFLSSCYCYFTKKEKETQHRRGLSLTASPLQNLGVCLPLIVSLPYLSSFRCFRFGNQQKVPLLPAVTQMVSLECIWMLRIQQNFHFDNLGIAEVIKGG